MPGSAVEARPRVRKALRQMGGTARQELLAAMRGPAEDPARVVTVAVIGHRRER